MKKFSYMIGGLGNNWDIDEEELLLQIQSLDVFEDIVELVGEQFKEPAVYSQFPLSGTFRLAEANATSFNRHAVT